ncbi:hypothetical protein PYCCODRAFT_1292819 [Trametes coccinea BRFM310]|uniref:Uncharacterized protein n=1 Tax=Trametes coccinea (strain BRFM310) TaxID=1353009 RepID=A0A1Y2IVH1_TRAC3|nr:hypothetical protein PYCCODRAFT_1292819 [Trametes coccinea BRFM310]
MFEHLKHSVKMPVGLSASLQCRWAAHGSGPECCNRAVTAQASRLTNNRQLRSPLRTQHCLRNRACSHDVVERNLRMRRPSHSTHSAMKTVRKPSGPWMFTAHLHTNGEVPIRRAKALARHGSHLREQMMSMPVNELNSTTGGPRARWSVGRRWRRPSADPRKLRHILVGRCTTSSLDQIACRRCRLLAESIEADGQRRTATASRLWHGLPSSVRAPWPLSYPSVLRLVVDNCPPRDSPTDDWPDALTNRRAAGVQRSLPHFRHGSQIALETHRTHRRHRLPHNGGSHSPRHDQHRRARPGVSPEGRDGHASFVSSALPRPERTQAPWACSRSCSCS